MVSCAFWCASTKSVSGQKALELVADHLNPFTRAHTFHLLIALSCHVTLGRQCTASSIFQRANKVACVVSPYQLPPPQSYQLSPSRCTIDSTKMAKVILGWSSSNPGRDTHLVVKVWWQLCSRRAHRGSRSSSSLRIGDKVAGPASPASSLLPLTHQDTSGRHKQDSTGKS